MYMYTVCIHKIMYNYKNAEIVCYSESVVSWMIFSLWLHYTLLVWENIYM